jgi:hypothetical protein
MNTRTLLEHHQLAARMEKAYAETEDACPEAHRLFAILLGDEGEENQMKMACMVMDLLNRRKAN